MLIRFVITNFLSFKEETEFNMLTGPVRRLKGHIYDKGDLSLLKTAAIYGANGAGKSNLVKALAFMKHIVIQGGWNPIKDLKPFKMQTDAATIPTELEVEFFYQKKSYSYGLVIRGHRILEEWLYETHVNAEDDLVFLRQRKEGQTQIKMRSVYTQNEKDKLRIKLYEEELLVDSMPLLKMMAEAKEVFPEIEAAYSWFKYYLLILFPSSRPLGLAAKFNESASFAAFAHELVAAAHTGITELKTETMDAEAFFGEDERAKLEELKSDLKQGKSQGLNQISLRSPSGKEEWVVLYEGEKLVMKRLLTRHGTADGDVFDFSLEEESDGTLRLLDFLPAVFMALNTEATVLIDEIGRSIHPALLKALLVKFTREPAHGQLIFTTHESQLLDQEYLRRDEIWFAEKKPTGDTTLYPLSDFDIRYDLDIQKGYLNGRFGAIPFLSNLQDLNWKPYAEEKSLV
jgi:AAA15 family ATPase/GTPase